MGNFIDLSGKVFGRLAVIDIAAREDTHKQHAWNCVCECGNKVVVPGGNLRSGNTKSCGCLYKEMISETRTTHGMSGTPQYQAWANAKDRTINRNNPEWPNYGGRGIKMCDEWLASPLTFCKDMNASWQPGLTLERKDVDGDYCPENCTWATESMQGHTKRKKQGCSSKCKGVCFVKRVGKIMAKIVKDGKQKYLGYFTTELDAAKAYDNASEELYGDRPNGTLK